jgi:hypothetical protein
MKKESVERFFRNLREVARIAKTVFDIMPPHSQFGRKWFWHIQIMKIKVARGYRAGIAVQEACCQRQAQFAFHHGMCVISRISAYRFLLIPEIIRRRETGH